MTTKSNQTECACCGNGSNVWHKLATLFGRARVGFEDTDNAPVCDSCWTTIGPNLTVERIRARRSQPEPKREGPSAEWLDGAIWLLSAHEEIVAVYWEAKDEGYWWPERADKRNACVNRVEVDRKHAEFVWAMCTLGNDFTRFSRPDLLATPDRTRAPEPWTPRVGEACEGVGLWSGVARRGWLVCLGYCGREAEALLRGDTGEDYVVRRDSLRSTKAQHGGVPPEGASAESDPELTKIARSLEPSPRDTISAGADPYAYDKTGAPKNETVIAQATRLADAAAWAALPLAEKRARQRLVALKELGRPNAALVTWPESWESPTYGSDH